MLALSIAIAFALHGDPFAESAIVQGVRPQTQAGGSQIVGSLIPFGQAMGTYTAPTWFANGSMLALLEDAAGHPLWALEAEILANGIIEGQLNLLRYASNPAYSMLELTVVGKAQFDSSGDGVFSATLYSLSLNAIPVFPLGQIEGVLKHAASASVAPTLPGKSGLVAMLFDAHAQDLPASAIAPSLGLRGGVIVCPKARDVAIGNVQSAGAFAQAGQSGVAGTGVIVCPKGRPAVVDHVQAGANLGSAGQVAALGQGIVKPARVVDPQFNDQPVLGDLNAAGAHAQIGTGMSAAGQGTLCLRWWLQP